jgi:hypothetical protein
MRDDIPLYTARREHGLWILHRDLACVALVHWPDTPLADKEQREHGRLCLLCGHGEMTSTGRSGARSDGMTGLERFARRRAES